MPLSSALPIESAPGELQPLHMHNDARLIVVVGGFMREETLDGEVDLCRGDVLFRPAFFSHADQTGASGARYIQVPVVQGLTLRWLRRHGWTSGSVRAPFTAREFRSLTRTGRLGDALMEHVRPSVRSNRRPLGWDGVRAILADVSAPPIAHVAQSLGLADYEFSRRFKGRFSLSPRTYRNQARLHRAMRMLAEGAASLADIAALCGFCDQSHLSRALKARTGHTPLGFRRAAGGA